MPHTRRHPPLAVLVALALLVTQSAPAFGYENNQQGAALGGGAHRKINQMAGALFMTEIVKGEQGALFKKYDFRPLEPADKYKVVALNADVDATRFETLFQPAGTTVAARMNWRDSSYDAAQKKVTGAFSEWVIEGGFTADEPERFMSLRHFYNPVQTKGPAYLTDIPSGSGWVMMGSNPQIDAITWATYHGDNQYNWNRGTEYLKKALSAYSLADVQDSYAAAWRSLGETMHLAADMTVPAHVRNDSHPGDWRAAAILDDLRADAYEYLTNWGGQVEAGWNSQVADPDFVQAIRESGTPDVLLKKVAGFVNSHFFSSDTIPFPAYKNGPLTALNVGSGNSIVYEVPRTKDMSFDEATGQITGLDSTDRPMLMAHESWLNRNGWNADPGTVQDAKGAIVNLATVQSQAQRLVPLAVWSAERLMELFRPLVEVKVASLETDQDTGAPLLTGQVAARFVDPYSGRYGTYPDVMQNTEQQILLFVRLTKKDGKTEERVYLAPPTEVRGGEFELSLQDCTNADGLHDILFPPADSKPAYTNIEYGLGLDMGGILVRSDYFGDAGIAGTWDVENTFEAVEIPPELLVTTGLSDEEAAVWIATMKQAYGASYVGQTFKSQVEIVQNGADYTMKPQMDEKTKAAMAGAGYSMDMPTKLSGTTVRAATSINYGVGSTGSTIEAELSADKKSMDGTFTATMSVPTGQGTITVVYKGTWKATKVD